MVVWVQLELFDEGSGVGCVPPARLRSVRLGVRVDEWGSVRSTRTPGSSNIPVFRGVSPVCLPDLPPSASVCDRSGRQTGQ